MNYHTPVMLSEVLHFLQPQAQKTYVDGTLGMGGHAAAILQATDGQIELIGFDRDEVSLEMAKINLTAWSSSTIFYNERFSALPALINKRALKYRLDGVLLDLGISSFQLDNADYGLTFSQQALNNKLDMRLDKWCKFSADDIVNTWPEKKIADLFWDYADYQAARKLARMILQERPVRTLGHFVKLCKRIKTAKQSRIHPATLPLMALRMAVNNELDELERGLKNIIEWLEPQAKVLVISFHSGEDRIVKNVFKQYEDCLQVITLKPQCPTEEEIAKNPRSRSAKLRVALKI